MPSVIVDTSGPGPIQDWDVLGPGPGWEMVKRGSGDTYRIQGDQLSQKGYFHCGAGWMPYYGEISAITLYYRARLDTPGQSATVYPTVIRNGLEEFHGPVVLTNNNWVDGSVRMKQDFIVGTRWTPEFVGDLGVGMFLWIPPAVGHVEVSELWLEVEYIDSTMVYDPTLNPVLPDFVTGDLSWATSGTQLATITVAEDLQIFDNAPLDYRSYERQELNYPEQYVTEIECRMECFFVPFVTHTGFFYYIAAYDDHDRSVYLVLYNIADRYYVGLIGAGLDHDDPNAYFDSVQIDPFIGEDLYFRLVVDRSEEIGSMGRVKLYMDYTDNEVLDVAYASFPATAADRLLFGTGDPLTALVAQRCGVRIDYFAWRHFKRQGETFDRWRDVEQGTNQVVADTSDPYIWKPIEIVPPGITAGQSEYACKLEVSDASVECALQQYWQVLEETPDTYDLDIDYRMDTLGATAGVTVQRRSDHYYWNDTTNLWQPGPFSVTLPNQMNRTRLAGVMTGITVLHPVFPYPYDEVFIVSLGKLSAVPASYNVYVYKAYLR
jgi:hypothetical protein